VSRALGEDLPERVRELLSFPLDSDVVRSIARCLIRWLGAPPDVRAAACAKLSETAAARYSWEGVARGVIAAARGELESLDSPA
jgi:hypothetical protein